MQISGSSEFQPIFLPSQEVNNKPPSQEEATTDSISISDEAIQLSEGSLQDPPQAVVNPSEPPYP